MFRPLHALSATLLACLAAVAAPSLAQTAPVTVDVVATDLVNTTSQDLWQFDLTVNGQMASNAQLRISLSPSLFSDVSVVSTAAGYATSIEESFGSRLLAITDNGSPAATSSFSVQLALVHGSLLLPAVVDMAALYRSSPAAADDFVDLRAFDMIPSAVPEASTLSMLGLGLVVLAMGLRRGSLRG